MRREGRSKCTSHLSEDDTPVSLSSSTEDILNWLDRRLEQREIGLRLQSVAIITLRIIVSVELLLIVCFNAESYTSDGRREGRQRGKEGKDLIREMQRVHSV